MKRRNTIDSFHGTAWPLCQYYYTHNTGSCDDVLLDKRKITTTFKQRKATVTIPAIRKKRRYTYPIVLLDQQAYEQQFREMNNLTTTPGLILRRWSTIRKHNKRRTLADIISNLTTQQHHDSPEESFVVDNNSSMILEKRWDLIRKYKEKEEAVTTMPLKIGTPLLKVKNKDETVVVEEASFSSITAEPSLVIGIPPQQQQAIIITGSTTENTMLMDSGININSSLLAHPPSSHSTTTTTSSAGQRRMENTNINRYRDNIYSSSTTSSESNEELSIGVPLSTKYDSNKGRKSTTMIDMFLFLFGFILFPLWWIGSWRYFTRHHQIDKKREVFQLLNCCMSLASLLLTGLIIGLTTVWA